MSARSLVVAAVLVLAGCARAMLPYQPLQQPPGATVSAAYQVVGDRLRIEIDTDGKRLEQVWIRKPDGTDVAPLTVDNPPTVATGGSSIGVGAGGGTWGGGGGYGSGVGITFPVGGGSSRVAGHTVAWFPLATAGAAPWPVYVKLAGIAPATILVGGPLPPR
jgi:hypothetical protein